MKKFLFMALMCAVLASCSEKVVTQTATTTTVYPIIQTSVIADVDIVSTKATYTYTPGLEVILGGKENIQQTAVANLLAQYNADVLMNPEYRFEYSDKRTIKSVTVTGYPAKYKNFRNTNQ